jgi:hypothetical protein
MTETKKTLAILRIRWPEVFLIIGLYTLADISVLFFMVENPGLANILTILFALGVGIISMLLNFGFLRTVHLEGSRKHTPGELLKTGERFFWRMVGAGIIYMILYFILVRIIFLIIKYLTSANTGFREIAKSNPLLYNLCIIAAMLILIKVILFIPALIIVLDCRIFESLKFLRECKLSESKELVALYLLSMVMLFPRIFLKIPNMPEKILQYTLRIGIDVIQQVIWFIIAVSAVRFVSSLNLVYDSDMKDSNSEDLLKNHTED